MIKLFKIKLRKSWWKITKENTYISLYNKPERITQKQILQRYINQSSHPNEQNLNLMEDNHQKSTHGDRGHIF